MEIRLDGIRSGFQQLLNGTPEVSIVMPAYNEEACILKALMCLSKSKTLRSVEVIVVNNNSGDRTAVLANATGVRCILESVQGITAARNAGLAAARGKYILNADADTLYPPNWIEEMITPLENDTVASVYGRFSFIPTTGTSRFIYFLYEYAADIMRWINKTFREEAMNVYGFNSGFRRNQGIQVEGFNHPPNTSEDNWLALKLRKRGFGKLHYVTKKNALVWTLDRRIQIDGGLRKGLVKRINRILTNNRKHR